VEANEKTFNYAEKGCLGHVNVADIKNRTTLRTGCQSAAFAYACDTCGRLHFSSTGPVTNRQNKPAYLIDGEVKHGRKYRIKTELPA